MPQKLYFPLKKVHLCWFKFMIGIPQSVEDSRQAVMEFCVQACIHHDVIDVYQDRDPH